MPGEPCAAWLRSVGGHSRLHRPTFMPRAPLAFACLVGLALRVALCGAEEPAIRDVHVGVSGHFKRGHWAEVTAVVTAGDQRLSGDLAIISRDGDGAAVGFLCQQPVELAAGESATFST